jgi:hypothetical protein
VADDKEVAEAFERGRLVGQREGLAFNGVPRVGLWTRGVEFEFEISWLESFVSYERAVLEDLRRVQFARWRESRAAASSPLGPLRRGGGDEDRLQDLQASIEAELSAARAAVDAELVHQEHQCSRSVEARRCAYAVEAMRASPQRPDWVREFQSLEEFVAEDRRRGVFDWPGRRDAGGADFGGRWRLENSFRRWETSSWRVSWLGPFDRSDESTYEVYAIERLSDPMPGAEHCFKRVWVLGKLPDWKRAEAALLEPQLCAQDDRNSLIVAARSVEAVAREVRISEGETAHTD